MSNLEFRSISEEDYRKFWDKSEQKCFLSAPEIGHLRDNVKLLFYGVFKSGKLVAAAMVRGSRTLGSYEFYAPRGILVDYSDFEVLKFFVMNLKKELKKEGGYLLRIEPNVEKVERDIDGNEVPDGYSNLNAISNLKTLGFRQKKYVEGLSQITWEFVLPVKGKTEEELISAMKPNTRRLIAQVETLGIEFKELKREELGEFYKVEMETASRKEFKARDLEYFERIYDLFVPSGKAKFISAVINPKKCIERLKDMQKKILAEVPETTREKKEHAEAIESIAARIKKAEEIFAGVSEDEVTLSSGLFFFMKPEILHLAGGNVSRYFKLGGQYLMQWEMIKRALSGGYDRYNFYGIPENVNKHPENYGVYEFKRGFSGKVVELIGEFELVIDAPKMKMIRALKKLKRII